jgi:hypothetical protein
MLYNPKEIVKRLEPLSETQSLKEMYNWKPKRE